MGHDDLRRYRVTLTALPGEDAPRYIVRARSERHAIRAFPKRRVTAVEPYSGVHDATLTVQLEPSPIAQRTAAAVRWTGRSLARVVRMLWRWIPNKDAKPYPGDSPDDERDRHDRSTR